MTSTLPPIVQAFSGAIGSAVAGALTYPLELVTTRIQLQDPNKKEKQGGLRALERTLRHIVQKHGVSGLYDGLSVDTIAKVLSNFFYFYFYSWLRLLSTRRVLSLSTLKWGTSARLQPPRNPGVIEELLLGFLAGVASRAVSTPLNIVTLRLQAEREGEEGEPGTSASLGIMGTVKHIYEEKGLSGFWKGFKSAIILSLNPSITLTIYQLFRRALTLLRTHPSSSMLQGRRLTKETPVNPSPGEAFIGAAISNSIAVGLLYPLILGKTRLQSSSANTLTEALVDAYEGTYYTSRVKREKSRALQDRALKPGIPGLYQGLEMQTLKGFFNQGVALLVKGRVEQLIVVIYMRSLERKVL